MSLFVPPLFSFKESSSSSSSSQGTITMIPKPHGVVCYSHPLVFFTFPTFLLFSYRPIHFVSCLYPLLSLRTLPNMECSRGSSCSHFIVLLVLTRLVLISSQMHPPSALPPSAYFPPMSNPAPAPSPPIGRNPSPSPSPTLHLPAPTVSPSHDDGPVPSSGVQGEVGERGRRSGGMSAWQKAGTAVAVMVGATVAVGMGLVCKKRRENVRRAEYSYAIRRDIL